MKVDLAQEINLDPFTGVRCAAGYIVGIVDMGINLDQTSRVRDMFPLMCFFYPSMVNDEKFMMVWKKLEIYAKENEWTI